MADYRRYFVPGGTYFFTVVTEGRVPLFRDPVARKMLGDLMRDCQQRWPFEINAIVLLPEHLHAIWSLPSGDAAYPRRWGWIKKEFTKAWLKSGGQEQPTTVSRQQRMERGIWQRRYWVYRRVGNLARPLFAFGFAVPSLQKYQNWTGRSAHPTGSLEDLKCLSATLVTV